MRAPSMAGPTGPGRQLENKTNKACRLGTGGCSTNRVLKRAGHHEGGYSRRQQGSRIEMWKKRVELREERSRDRRGFQEARQANPGTMFPGFESMLCTSPGRGGPAPSPVGWAKFTRGARNVVPLVSLSFVSEAVKVPCLVVVRYDSIQPCLAPEPLHDAAC